MDCKRFFRRSIGVVPGCPSTNGRTIGSNSIPQHVSQVIRRVLRDKPVVPLRVDAVAPMVQLLVMAERIDLADAAVGAGCLRFQNRLLPQRHSNGWIRRVHVRPLRLRDAVGLGEGDPSRGRSPRWPARACLRGRGVFRRRSPHRRRVPGDGETEPGRLDAGCRPGHNRRVVSRCKEESGASR